MTKIKKKRWNGKRIILSLVVVYAICQLLGNVHTVAELHAQQNQLSQELDAAYQEQEKLKSQLEYMSSEEAIEEIAREKLGLVKDHEILIQRIGQNQNP